MTALRSCVLPHTTKNRVAKSRVRGRSPTIEYMLLRVGIVVRCLWKKRDHEEAVSFDDLGDPREGRSSVCRSWTVPRAVDRSRWRSITRVSSCGGLGDRCERSIGRSAYTWTASRRCACGSGASARRNARIATRNPPSCTCTASLLKWKSNRQISREFRLGSAKFSIFYESFSSLL